MSIVLLVLLVWVGAGLVFTAGLALGGAMGYRRATDDAIVAAIYRGAEEIVTLPEPQPLRR